LSFNKKESKALWWWLGFLTALFIFLVLIRQYSFDTHAYDLGIFDQGTWRYSRLEAPYSSIKEVNLLGDHFTLVLALAAPFYWIWNGPETLLVLQVLAIMSGAFPAYHLSRKYLKTNLCNYPPIFFTLFFGVQSALDFDFHTDTIAAAAFMWAVWAFEARYTARYLAFLGLALLCKETFPVYLSFWALYALITRWHEPRQRYMHAGLFLGGFGLFFIELNLLIPLVAGHPYYYTDYGELGHSMSEVVNNSLQDPGKLLNAFFGEPSKRELWLIFFISCGGALFFRPTLLLILIPNVIERFLNPSPLRWLVYYHYSVILTPFYTYAIILALATYERQNGRWGKFYLPKTLLKLGLAIILLLNAFVYAPLIRNGVTNIAYLFQDRSSVWEALRLIPPEASVLASDSLVPHLTHRETIATLLSPEVSQPDVITDYVIISLQVERNPIKQSQLADEVNRFRQRADYKLIYERNQNYIFCQIMPSALVE